MLLNFVRASQNKKTGPIPVSTTSDDTCPESCPLLGNGCYAAYGPLRMHWQKLSDGIGITWSEFLTRVRKMRSGQFWRHNQAGDLPGTGDTLDVTMLAELVSANRGKKGFTYTHKPLKTKAERVAVAEANRKGFVVNLSGNNLAHADALADLAIAPVVAVLPSTVQGNAAVYTPAGRRVVVCPATYREEVSCDSCRLCAVSSRPVIVGFPAHGIAKRKVDAIAIPDMATLP